MTTGSCPFLVGGMEPLGKTFLSIVDWESIHFISGAKGGENSVEWQKYFSRHGVQFSKPLLQNKNKYDPIELESPENKGYFSLLNKN